ncbi:MAG: hypothetical protein ACRYHQ_35445 [Janthinobacterium lividum]
MASRPPGGGFPDVTVQARVLRLIRSLQKAGGASVLLNTHGFGVVREVAGHAVVMYAGHNVEDGPVRELLSRPAQSYTVGLLRSACKDAPDGCLAKVSDTVPPLRGRTFGPHCGRAVLPCADTVPPVLSLGGAHSAACILAAET